MTQATRSWGAKQTGKTVKLIHAHEMLDAIENATGDAKVLLLREYGAKAPLNYLLSLNYRSDINLDLPHGMPPLNPKEMDTATHPDMMGLLAANIHKLKNCRPAREVPANGNISPSRKEKIFTDVLLMCPMQDAEIVCAAKDKELDELYPSITAELVKSVFPTFVK